MRAATNLLPVLQEGSVRHVSQARLHTAALLALLALLLGCTAPPLQNADQTALDVAQNDGQYAKLEFFQLTFNDERYRQHFTESMNAIQMRVELEAQVWGEDRYRVFIRDFIGEKENKSDLWLDVDARAQKVVAYSPDLAPGSLFMAGVDAFVKGSDVDKAATVLRAVSNQTVIDTCELWGDSRDYCFYSMAKIRNEPLLCDKVDSVLDLYFCRSAVYRDIEHCKPVKSLEGWACRTLGTVKPEDCSPLTREPDAENEPSKWEQCIANIPRNNPAAAVSTCDNIAFQPLRDDCIQVVAANKGDEKLCDKLAGEKNTCLALATKDASHCEGAHAYDCFALLAKQEADASLCPKAKEPVTCLSDVAVFSQNPELCGEIPAANKKERQACLTYTRDIDWQALFPHLSLEEIMAAREERSPKPVPTP